MRRSACLSQNQYLLLAVRGAQDEIWHQRNTYPARRTRLPLFYIANNALLPITPQFLATCNYPLFQPRTCKAKGVPSECGDVPFSLVVRVIGIVPDQLHRVEQCDVFPESSIKLPGASGPVAQISNTRHGGIHHSLRQREDADQIA